MHTRDEFRKQVKNVLDHLYDTAYLEAHPLVEQLVDINASGEFTKAYLLRNLLKKTIQSLKPNDDLTSRSADWRSYQALSYRYISGLSLVEIEHEMGISQRQLHRELRKGLDGIAAILWDKRNEPNERDIEQIRTDSATKNSLENTLDEWDIKREPFSLQNLFEKVAWTLNPILKQHQDEDFFQIKDSGQNFVCVDLTLTHLAFVKIFRFLLTKQESAQAELLIQNQSENVIVDINVEKEILNQIDNDNEWTDATRLLAMQGVVIRKNIDSVKNASIQIIMPRAGQSKILVIDDNPGIQRLLQRYLETSNYLVFEETDGKRAIRAVQNINPDAIILDLMIPTIDGWEILRQMINDSEMSKVPVIVCSVLDEAKLAFSLGAKAFIKKPIDRVQLLTTLRQVLLRVSLESEADRG